MPLSTLKQSPRSPPASYPCWHYKLSRLSLTPDPLAPGLCLSSPPFPARTGQSRQLRGSFGVSGRPHPRKCVSCGTRTWLQLLSPGVCIPALPLSRPISFSLPGIWEETRSTEVPLFLRLGKRRGCWGLSGPCAAPQSNASSSGGTERGRHVPAPFIPLVLVECLLCAWH